MSDGFWHEVEQGEWVTKIAGQYHITDWRKTIWGHPENATLAANRDPNLLFPGDQIFIPTPKPKEVSRGTDQAHPFVVKKQWDEFFLKVFDAAGQPLAGESYVLDVGTAKYEGATDGHGEIHIPKMDPGAQDGSLVFPEKYLVLRVQMGQMNPGQSGTPSDTPRYDDGVSGLQMRLANLGYDPGEADGIFGPHTKAAVTEFQIFEMGRDPDQATGQLDDDTRQAIIGKHGS